MTRAHRYIIDLALLGTWLLLAIVVLYFMLEIDNGVTWLIGSATIFVLGTILVLLWIRPRALNQPAGDEELSQIGPTINSRENNALSKGRRDLKHIVLDRREGKIYFYNFDIHERGWPYLLGRKLPSKPVLEFDDTDILNIHEDFYFNDVRTTYVGTPKGVLVISNPMPHFSEIRDILVLWSVKSND